MKKNNNYAIILAAGEGIRLGSQTPKCFIKINGKEIYKYSLQTFINIKQFKKIVLVVPEKYINKIHNKKVVVVSGGKNRNESFENGLKAIIKNANLNDKVFVHDAARPFIKSKDIKVLLNSKVEYGTLAILGKKNKIDFHIGKYNIQTPQFFTIKKYLSIKNKNKNGKDMISYFNVKPNDENFFNLNTKENIKITYMKDLEKWSNRWIKFIYLFLITNHLK